MYLCDICRGRWPRVFFLRSGLCVCRSCAEDEPEWWTDFSRRDPVFEIPDTDEEDSEYTDEETARWPDTEPGPEPEPEPEPPAAKRIRVQ